MAPHGAGGIDLSGLDAALRYDSGWVPLAAGLQLAHEGFRPRPNVAASGAWSADYGVSVVEGLPAKLTAAAALGVSQFFVPASQAGEAQTDWGRIATNSAAASLKIEPLRDYASGKSAGDQTKVREALRDLLIALGQRPDAGTDWNVRLAYYELLGRGGEAQTYYLDTLLSDLVDRCRQCAVFDGPTLDDRLGSAPQLVTTVSDGWETIPLIAATLRVTRCLLLYDHGQSRYGDWANQVRRRLAQRGIVTEQAGFDGQADYPGLRAAFAGAVAEFAAKFSGSHAAASHAVPCGISPAGQPTALVFDATLGNKLMTLAMVETARTLIGPAATNRSGGHIPHYVCYLRHNTPQGRPKPGTEKIEFLDLA